MTKITVSKLANVVVAGDWHDKPLKWKVAGPNQEVQIFSTRKLADAYAKIRRHTDTVAKAQREFAWAKI